ncbi:MAG: hypothetical protein WAO02_17320 [Verrucomicrobiia bacterium]
MNTRTILFLLALAGTLPLCNATKLAALPASIDSPSPQLYLHFFAPAYVTGKDTLPPRLIITTKIHLGDDFDIRAGMNGEALSGRIEARDGRFFGQLRGTFGTSTGDYNGEVELEKEIGPTTYGFSGAICMTYFALSTNDDFTPFLANHTLSKADVPWHLLERKGDQIVNAPPEDHALARTYNRFQDKGVLLAGQRITIMTHKTQYRTGEPIRVLHVLEAVKQGIEVYVMGPKMIYDEYVDGKLVSPKGPGDGSYDGPVVSSPTADFNYDITTYTFSEPGEHTIQWKGGGYRPRQGSLELESNIIKLEIVKE